MCLFLYAARLCSKCMWGLVPVFNLCNISALLRPIVDCSLWSYLCFCSVVLVLWVNVIGWGPPLLNWTDLFLYVFVCVSLCNGNVCDIQPCPVYVVLVLVRVRLWVCVCSCTLLQFVFVFVPTCVPVYVFVRLAHVATSYCVYCARSCTCLP